MNILVTAGGTSERIDEVRKISNIATGRLGSLIADAFLQKDTAVTYLCCEGAILPKSKKTCILYVDNVKNLQLTLERLLGEQRFDAVIHTMAVSDYSVKFSITSYELANYLTESFLKIDNQPVNREQLLAHINLTLSEYAVNQTPAKISSEIENLYLCLEKTPKVIKMFKERQPDTVLVGFKLLANANKEELLIAAKNLMDTNHCDYVLANDKRDINAAHHAGILIGTDRTVGHFNTKQEIAAAIVNCVIQKIKEKV
jgi:phosphopantothenate-cysteine ligase